MYPFDREQSKYKAVRLETEFQPLIESSRPCPVTRFAPLRGKFRVSGIEDTPPPPKIKCKTRANGMAGSATFCLGIRDWRHRRRRPLSSATHAFYVDTRTYGDWKI